jgi:hypothetical protein
MEGIRTYIFIFLVDIFFISRHNTFIFIFLTLSCSLVTYFSWIVFLFFSKKMCHGTHTCNDTCHRRMNLCDVSHGISGGGTEDSVTHRKFEHIMCLWMNTRTSVSGTVPKNLNTVVARV